MKIDDQIKTLNKRKNDLYKRWCAPLDEQIKNLENIKIQLAKQNTIDFENEKQQQNFDRNNAPFEFSNRPEIATWEFLERGKGI